MSSTGRPSFAASFLNKRLLSGSSEGTSLRACSLLRSTLGKSDTSARPRSTRDQRETSPCRLGKLARQRQAEASPRPAVTGNVGLHGSFHDEIRNAGAVVLDLQPDLACISAAGPSGDERSGACMPKRIRKQIINHLPEPRAFGEDDERASSQIDGQNDPSRVGERSETVRHLADNGTDVDFGGAILVVFDGAFRVPQHRFHDPEQMPRRIPDPDDVAVIPLVLDGTEVPFRHHISRRKDR